MASYEIAFEWLMTSEDPLQAHKAVPDAPPGAFAISGINSHAFPVQFQRIAALPQDSRAAAVRDFYQAMFWSNWLAQLESDDIAKRVFDAAVNMGPETAVELLQTAIETVSGITGGVDGQWGPVTLQRANGCNPDLLAAAFRLARCAHYSAIVKAKPALARYLSSWLVRANK